MPAFFFTGASIRRFALSFGLAFLTKPSAHHISLCRASILYSPTPIHGFLCSNTPRSFIILTTSFGQRQLLHHNSLPYTYITGTGCPISIAALGDCTRAHSPPASHLSPLATATGSFLHFDAPALHPLSYHLNFNAIQNRTTLSAQSGFAPLLSTLLLATPDSPSLAASLRV